MQPVSLYILSAVFVSHPMCQSASLWRQREVNKSSEESCLLSSVFVGRQQNTNFDSLLRQQSDKTKITTIIIIIKTISQQQFLQNQGESCHLNERKWLAANLQQTNSEILMFQFSTFFFFFSQDVLRRGDRKSSRCANPGRKVNYFTWTLTESERKTETEIKVWRVSRSQRRHVSNQSRINK